MNIGGITASSTREKGEPTLPLINIVFLMLIFFLVTAQMARPLDPGIQLVQTDDPTFVPPPDAVVISASGDITFRGVAVVADDVIAILQGVQAEEITVRVLPDARAPADRVIKTVAALQQAGANAVFIITEHGL